MENKIQSTNNAELNEDIDLVSTSQEFSFAQYQEKSYTRLNQHASAELRTLNWAIGIGEEAGEIQGIVKHIIFGGEALDDEKKAQLAKEVGDVLWYVSALCSHFDMDLGACAKLNVAKLRNRYNHTESYSLVDSQNRHAKEAKFSNTEIYRKLVQEVLRQIS